MKSHGDVDIKICPVCASAAIANIWKIPFSAVEQATLGKIPLRQVPLLSSDLVYNYSQCNNCGTIFLNPVSSAYWDNRANTHHADKGRKRQDWSNYRHRVNVLLNVPITQYNTVIDVAAGGCQCLTIMKELKIPWKRMIATDIRDSSVAYAKELGYESYLHDICLDEPICKNEANYIIFAEAFEHVQSPLVAMHNIAQMLAPDGYVYFTATATEGNLPVRPGENIMTNEKALLQMLALCTLGVVYRKFTAQRWTIIAQKVSE